MHVHGINASTVTRASAGTLVVVSFARGALCRTGGALCSSAAAPAVDAHLPSWRSEAVVASARAPGSNLCLCCDASLDLFLFIVDLGRAGCLTDDVGEAPLSRAASVSMGGLSGELERRRQSLTAKPWRVLRISQGRRVAKSSCGLLIIRRWPCASGAPAGRFSGYLSPEFDCSCGFAARSWLRSCSTGCSYAKMPQAIKEHLVHKRSLVSIDLFL